MTKEQILNYLRATPANTNPAVVEGMLDQMSGSDEISQYVTLFKTYPTLNEAGTGVDFSPVDVEEIDDALDNDKLMLLLVDPKNVDPNGEQILCAFFKQDMGYLVFSAKYTEDKLQININSGAVGIYEPIA